MEIFMNFPSVKMKFVLILPTMDYTAHTEYRNINLKDTIIMVG